MPNTQATVYTRNLEVTSNIPMTLRQAITTKRLHHYMQEKYEWANAVEDIHWEVHGRALNAFTFIVVSASRINVLVVSIHGASKYFTSVVLVSAVPLSPDIN